MEIGSITTLEELTALIAAGQPLPRGYRVPAEVYHTCPGVIGHSGLLKYKDTPAHYVAFTREQFRRTKAMMMGDATHCRILEPELFATRFALNTERPQEVERPTAWTDSAGTVHDMTQVTRRSAAGKATVAEWEATWRPAYTEAVLKWEAHMAGKELLDDGEWALIQGLAANVLNDSYFHQFVNDGVPELSMFARDPETGVWVKIRMDYYIPSKNVIVDIKTTLKTGPDSINAEIFKMDYDIQGALYMDAFEWCMGFRPRAYVTLWLDKVIKEPYTIRLTDDALTAGRNLYRPLLDDHANCMAVGKWPAYPRRIVDSTVPEWRMRSAGLEVV